LPYFFGIISEICQAKYAIDNLLILPKKPQKHLKIHVIVIELFYTSYISGLKWPWKSENVSDQLSLNPNFDLRFSGPKFGILVWAYNFLGITKSTQKFSPLRLFRSDFCTTFGSLNMLLILWNDEHIHSILRRNFQTCEHSSFFSYCKKYVLWQHWKFGFLLMLVRDVYKL